LNHALYYWEHFSKSAVNSIWLSLLVDDYPVFEKRLNKGETEYPMEDKERDIPVYELNEEDMELEDDSDISHWIKRTSGG
jgi:hypothetical protein